MFFYKLKLTPRTILRPIFGIPSFLNGYVRYIFYQINYFRLVDRKLFYPILRFLLNLDSLDISISLGFKTTDIILIESTKIQSSITRFKPVLDFKFSSNSITPIVSWNQRQIIPFCFLPVTVSKLVS
jgi:hypothetical protein